MFRYPHTTREIAMQTKLAKLKAAAHKEDWKTALSIAAKFPRLGDDKIDIMRAHECLAGAENFYRQLGYDPAALIQSGIATLKAKYKLGDTEMTAKAKAPVKKPARKTLRKTAAKPAAKAERSKTKKAETQATVKAADAAKAFRGAWRARYEQAIAGKLPEPPDFSAPSHKPYRAKLAAIEGMAREGNVSGLKAFEIKPISSSRVALDKYRNLCITALAARAT